MKSGFKETTCDEHTLIKYFAYYYYYYYYYAAFNAPCVGDKDDESQALAFNIQTLNNKLNKLLDFH